MKIFLKSITIIVGHIFISINPLYANDTNVSNTIIGNGIGIGSALAIAICWTRTNSVLTSVLAGFFGWIYVIYYLVIRDKEQ